jgi:hypothetical protein
MSRDVTQNVLDELNKDVIYPFFAIELLFDGDEVLRLWTGVGTLVFQDVSWYGTGSLLQIDTIEETSEIAAKGATVTLSGVPSEVLSLALSEPYQGRQAKIYFGTFTQGSLLQEDVIISAYILLQGGGKISLEDRRTELTEIFAGYMDQMNIEEAEGGSTVQLTIENKLIDLERPRTARFTNAYQKYLYPNDKGLEFVEDLQTKELFWGKAAP